MVSSLSQSDIARLLAEPSPHLRAEVATKLAAEIDSPRLIEAELKLAQEIIGILAGDVEVTVRKALSQSLRSAVRLPHDMALRLANDIESISLPILAYSPVLTDQDLADIVRKGSSAKQEVIAGRPNMSEAVSDILISEAEEKAIATLMANASAHISEISLGRAVNRFSGNETIMSSMVKRHSLPITIAEWLVALVSEQLQDYLVSHHELSPSIAADLVLQSRERGYQPEERFQRTGCRKARSANACA